MSIKNLLYLLKMDYINFEAEVSDEGNDLMIMMINPTLTPEIYSQKCSLLRREIMLNLMSLQGVVSA